MKNYFIKSFFLFVFCASVTRTDAQIDLGAGFNYNAYLVLPPIQHISAMASAEYKLDLSSARLFLTLGFPSYAEKAFDMKDIVTGNYVETIMGAEKYRFNQIVFDYKRYLFSGDAEDGGFYSSSGIGLTTFIVKNIIGDYNSDSLAPISEYPVRNKLYSLIVRGGIGGEINITYGQLFAEAYFTMPIYQLSSQPFPYILPRSVGLGIGYKLPIN